MISELAVILDRVFLHRHDIYARQLENGSYICIHQPLRQSHIEAHLRGDLTLGAYALAEKSMGKWLVLDADSEPDWRRLNALSIVLTKENTQSYLERSRRGGHLWFFFSEPIPGKEIRQFGYGLLAHFGIKGIELFPKQDYLKKGPGSLIRLPFGVHRKSGGRYGFFENDGNPFAPTLRGQIHKLEAHETVSNQVFGQFKDIGLEPASKKRKKLISKPLPQNFEQVNASELAEQIKASVSVQEFVSQYVELSPQGTGLCPFHDDNNPSFSVNQSENYWYCFTCKKGGSVIDFFMELQGYGFRKALSELSEKIRGADFQI